MFTWIQKYFQRHFGLVFALILAAMAIPLVVIFAPSSGIGQGDRTALKREVFGYNLGSPEDQARLFGDANLSATLQLGYSGISSEQLQQYALQRAAALHLADLNKIPATTSAEVADYIKGLRAFSTADGTFDAQRYASFRDSLKAGASLTEADVSRVIAADVRADKMRKLLAGPGYVLDADVKAQLARAETSWTLSTATVDYTSYDPGIKPSSDDLAKFFGDNNFRYEIGPRVVATSIFFPASDYLSQIHVTEDEMRAFFETSPGRFHKPAKDAKSDRDTVPATADDFEQVRLQVEEAINLAKTRQLASKAAADLSLEFYNSKLTNDPAVLDSFLAAHHLKERSLKAFTQAEGPSEITPPSAVANAAFKLNNDRFYTDALPVADGAVVLLWKETLPARMPLLSEVLPKVTDDYIENEKRKRFVELGKKVKGLVETRLKAGDSFAAAIQSAASTTSSKIDVKTMPAFTPSNPPENADYSLFGPLDSLEKGGLSDMIIAKDHGSFVYAADKQTPDLSEANPKYAETRAQIAAVTSRLGANQVLEELVAKELGKSEPKLN